MSRLTLLLQLIVKRRGLDLTNFGLVDARAVKRQRLGEEATGLPISLQMYVCQQGRIFSGPVMG